MAGAFHERPTGGGSLLRHSEQEAISPTTATMPGDRTREHADTRLGGYADLQEEEPTTGERVACYSYDIEIRNHPEIVIRPYPPLPS